MSKLGSLLHWLQIAEIAAPLALKGVKGGDKIAQIIPQVSAGIQAAQQIPGATNEEKKAHVMAIGAAAVTAANAAGAHLDPAEITPILSNGIDEAVAVIKAVHKLPVEAPTVVGTDVSGVPLSSPTGD